MKEILQELSKPVDKSKYVSGTMEHLPAKLGVSGLEADCFMDISDVSIFAYLAGNLIPLMLMHTIQKLKIR